MNFEEGLDIADRAIFDRIGRRMSKVEIAILQGSWQEQTYDEIADATNYSVSYLKRHVGPEMWKILSEALGEPVSKNNFRFVLERRWRNHGMRDRRVSDEAIEETSQSSLSSHQDWGEAMDVSTFYGRCNELDTLRQWIEQDRCRLVAILGMGGIGKTAISVKLAQQIQDGFEYAIWRSLRNAPPLAMLLGELVPFLSDQQETKAEIGALIHYLRTSRCLLILDNVETILQDGDRIGQCRPDYEGYEELFRVIGETSHQSCLILTSREKPAAIAILEGKELSTRSLSLQGSTEVSLALLQAKGVSGLDTQQQELCDRYSNSPLALKIVATSIRDLFDGEIGEFLKQDTIVFNGIRRLLDRQFDRLSPLEQTIMYWLAINREWTSISELQSDIVPAISRASLLEALEGLSWRSLIEKQAGKYTLQPVVMEYVTNRFIEQIVTELTTQAIAYFNRYALLKTTVKDYVRESQRRLILDAIATRLCQILGSKQTVEQQLQKILNQLQNKNDNLSSDLSGYGGGNLINLYCHLGTNLAGYDFSHLTLWQAYLQNANLQRVNLSYTNLAKSAFSQTFGAIYAVAFSPNGKLLAIGEFSGEIRLWRIADSQLLLTLQGHTYQVMSLRFSPDGMTLVSGSIDSTLKLWDVRTGRLLDTLQSHTNWIWCVDWSSNDRILASASADSTIKLWDAGTGKLLNTLQGHSDRVFSVRFSPDGNMLASGGQDRIVRLWDVHTGQLLQTLQGHTGEIWSVAWSPDRTTLASSSNDQTVKLWDVSCSEMPSDRIGHFSGQLLTTLQNNSWVMAVAWSPDSMTLASSNYDRTVKLWDVSSVHVLRSLQGHTSWVWTVDWSPDGIMLASGGNDQTVRLWDVARSELQGDRTGQISGQLIKTLQGYANWVISVDWSPDGTILSSVGSEQTVKLWDIKTGKICKILRGHTGSLTSVRFSPDGQTLASGSNDQTVRLWDISRLEIQSDRATQLFSQPSSSQISGQLLTTLQGITEGVWAIAWSPDCTKLASGGVDQIVRLWDIRTGQVSFALQGHTHYVCAVAFSPDGTTLASGGYDQTVRLWHAQTGKMLRILEEHAVWITSVAFSPDSRTLASGSYDRTIRLWDVSTGKTRQILRSHTNPVLCVAFSPNGKILASGAVDQTIKLWDVRTGKILRNLHGHTSWIWSVAWNPDSSGLASGSADGTIKLWDMKTGECLQTLRSDRPYEGMNIKGITSITEAQKVTLKALGAIEQ